jgi:putative DNA primase/helicase
VSDDDDDEGSNIFRLITHEPISTEKAEAEISRLAKLSALDYDRQREGASARLDIRKATLDKLVDDEREKLARKDDVSLDRVPALETVVGAELVAELIADLTKYVSLEPEYAVTTAFWVIHTYLLDYTPITPRLAITAPEKRCGKTTLVDWLSTVVQRPKRSDNITAAAVYRAVEALRPTLLIDEADTYLHDNKDLRGILNSGHRSDGTVTRMVKQGDEWVPKDFSTYSACAISLIGGLPETLHDRSVQVRLRRRTADEKISSLRTDRVDDGLARKSARWALDCRDAYANAVLDPEMPPEITNRAADNWRPLFAIADVIGREWPQRLREIAVNVVLLEAGEDPSTGAKLLQDIRVIFRDREWITTASLVSHLQRLEWPIRSGKSLAIMLKPYRIEPRQERRGVNVERGYLTSVLR